MLTEIVNIAVFAAFHNRFCRRSGSTPEFKPICRGRQLDVWCYGWQKRQEVARECCRFCHVALPFCALPVMSGCHCHHLRRIPAPLAARAIRCGRLTMITMEYTFQYCQERRGRGDEGMRG